MSPAAACWVSQPLVRLFFDPTRKSAKNEKTTEKHQRNDSRGMELKFLTKKKEPKVLFSWQEESAKSPEKETNQKQLWNHWCQFRQWTLWKRYSQENCYHILRYGKPSLYTGEWYTQKSIMTWTFFFEKKNLSDHLQIFLQKNSFPSTTNQLVIFKACCVNGSSMPKRTKGSASRYSKVSWPRQEKRGELRWFW